MSDKTIVIMAGIKGMLMALIISAVAETTFIQGLVTAVLSASVSGTFLLVSVRLTNKRTDNKVQEVKDDVNSVHTLVTKNLGIDEVPESESD